MNKKLIVLVLITRLFSLAAAANHVRKRYKKHRNHPPRGQFYDYANVKSVTPIIETIEDGIPRQCHY